MRCQNIAHPAIISCPERISQQSFSTTALPKSASRSFLSLSTIWFLLSYVAVSSFLSAVLSISPFDQEYICIFYFVVPHLSLSILSVLLPVYIMFLCYLYIYPSLFQLFPLCLRPSTLFCLFNSLFLLSRYPLAFYK